MSGSATFPLDFLVSFGVVDALRYVEALLRCNEALAQLLEAGCGPVAELLGRRLMAG